MLHLRRVQSDRSELYRTERKANLVMSHRLCTKRTNWQSVSFNFSPFREVHKASSVQFISFAFYALLGATMRNAIFIILACCAPVV